MIFLRSVLVTAVTSSASLAFAGGGDIFDWINPNGGEYQNPLNWSSGSVPQLEDDARFDLVNAYEVTGDYISAQRFLVGRSDVLFDLNCGGSGKGNNGCGYISLDSILVGNGPFEVPRELDNPGSIGLTSGDIYADSTILGNGQQPLASRIRFFKNTWIQTTNLEMKPQSSIDFNVDSTTGMFGGQLRLGSGQQTLGGGIFVRTDFTNPPTLGQRIPLLETFYPSTIPNNLFPFRILEPAPLRAFELEWDLDSGKAVQLVSEVVVSDTFASVSLNQSDELGDVPTNLLTTDLNDDGRDDLVVLVDSGVIRVYESLPGGLFDTPVEYPACQNPVDATAADFDGDGTTDLAIGCSGDSTLLFYLNPDADPSLLVAGPSTTVAGEIRSLAQAEFFTTSLVSRRGPTVTTRTRTGGGRTKGYVVNDGNALIIADIEVGDDPGPSDPIDDEQKKDPDSPIGVGGDTVPLGYSRGAQPVPSLMILEPTIEAPGFEIVKTIPLTGRAIDFATADLDGDGNLETLVVTENGHLDLVRPELDYPVHSLILDSVPTSIAIGELRDGGTPEIVIGTSDKGLDFYRVIPSIRGPFGEAFVGTQVNAITLERYAFSRLNEAPTDVAVTTVEAIDDDSEVIVGLPGGSGAPSVNVNEVENLPVPPCTESDFNGDYEVNALDLAYILGYWGPCQSGPCTAFDLNGDGTVDSQDLGLLFTSWGSCDP